MIQLWTNGMRWLGSLCESLASFGVALAARRVDAPVRVQPTRHRGR